LHLKKTIQFQLQALLQYSPAVVDLLQNPTLLATCESLRVGTS